MRTVHLSLLFISVFACLCALASCHHESEHIRLSDVVVARTAKKLRKQYPKMRLIGTGGGYMDCVHMLAMSFDMDYPLDKKEARIVLVNCVREFLQEINQDQPLRPFLETSPEPFSVKNIEVEVFSSNPDGSWVYDPYITVASCVNGIVRFATKDPDQKFGYKNQYEETYEEALLIVQEDSK